MGLTQGSTCEIVRFDFRQARRPALCPDDNKATLFDWMYANAPKKIVMLAFPERSWRGLEKRGVKRGLRRPGSRVNIAWGGAAVAELQRNWLTKPRSEIERLFPGRSWHAICGKALKLGLRRHAPAPDAQPLTHIPGERWRPIAGLEHYAVSDRGRVATGARLMRQLLNRGGRPTVWLSNSGRATSRAVAALVLSAFGPPKPSNAYVVGHLDGNERNVAIENLAWVVRRGWPGRRAKSAARRSLPLPLGERLRSSLSRDPIWSAADNALSRNIRPDVREDVIANMILAHLEGALPLEAFSSRASDFVRTHNRFYSTKGKVSLEQNIPGTDGLRIGDLVSEDDYRGRWETLRERS